MYKVIKDFADLQDNNYIYRKNDIFPRKGFDVLPSRIKELATAKNRQGQPLIEEIEEAPKKKKSAKKAEE